METTVSGQIPNRGIFLGFYVYFCFKKEQCLVSALKAVCSMSLACKSSEYAHDEISAYLVAMDKFRQEDLDAFDESIMEAKATTGSECIQSRKVRAEARIDRDNKTANFKLAVSQLQTDYAMCQAELVETKQKLFAAMSKLQAGSAKLAEDATAV